MTGIPEPLDPEAIKKANEAVAPLTGGRRLTMEPEDLQYRRLWAQAYRDAMAKKQAKAPPADDLQVVGSVMRSCSCQGKLNQRYLTKDVVVIGWIDPSAVTLPTSVDTSILMFYPSDGKVWGDQRVLTTLHLGWLAKLDAIHPVENRLLTAVERKYILNWMFKYGANRKPPSAFVSTGALADFVFDRTNYKLYNRLQMKYEEDCGGRVVESSVSVWNSETCVGTTIDPVWHRKVSGEAGPMEGARQMMSAFCWQINDGTPDSLAVQAFNTLAEEGGVKWSNIGSRITEWVPGTAYSVKHQVYPTYQIYEGGVYGKAPEAGYDESFKLVSIKPQASEPIQNFTANPYPPGPAPFVD